MLHLLYLYASLWASNVKKHSRKYVKATPDAGVLKLSKVKAFGKNIYFYNAFAANDPQSTLMI